MVIAKGRRKKRKFEASNSMPPFTTKELQGGLKTRSDPTEKVTLQSFGRGRESDAGGC
jgi:hypothetical protein